MQQLKLFSAIILSASLLSACSGNSAANAGKENVSPATNESASKGDASFSYTIDGKVFSGSGTDNYFNCAIKHPGNVIHFIFTELHQSLKNPLPQFDFSVADNGTTVIKRDDIDRLTSGSDVKYFANFSTPGGAPGGVPNYEFNDSSTVTVTITSNTSSRLKGTFSGNLINPDTKKVVQLTDGKFDIPFSSHSK